MVVEFFQGGDMASLELKLTGFPSPPMYAQRE